MRSCASDDVDYVNKGGWIRVRQTHTTFSGGIMLESCATGPCVFRETSAGNAAECGFSSLKSADHIWSKIDERERETVITQTCCTLMGIRLRQAQSQSPEKHVLFTHRTVCHRTLAAAPRRLLLETKGKHSTGFDLNSV